MTAKRRILSVWLPNWPVTRLNRLKDGASPDKPLVTVEAARGVRRIAALGPEAEAAGLRHGQSLTDARAICPGLTPEDADPPADLTALEALAAWCLRYTPMAAANPPDGLWLDITGCGHLSGGDAALAAQLGRRLDRRAIPSRIALASTPGAAWALARSLMGDDRALLTPAQERAALMGLPVAALRLDARSVAGLRRLGLRTVGELARLPRAEITARFGAMPVLRMDQAFGHAEEPVAWLQEPAPWSERMAFADPIGTPEDLRRALRLLAQRLCARLGAADLGGRRFMGTFHRVDGAAQCAAIGTSLPVRDPAYIAKLLDEKLETIDPGFGVEVVVLEAAQVGALKTPQERLGIASDGTGGAADCGMTAIDGLANRIGPDRVWRVAPRDSHVPERAVRRMPAGTLADRAAWIADPASPRPIRLLRHPEPIEATALMPDDPPIMFRWRGAMHRVRASDGPERIAAEWWRRHHPDDSTGWREERELIRDYYRVEDAEGARFWLFRTGLEGAPRWYLHGLFA